MNVRLLLVTSPWAAHEKKAGRRQVCLYLAICHSGSLTFSVHVLLLPLPRSPSRSCPPPSLVRAHAHTATYGLRTCHRSKQKHWIPGRPKKKKEKKEKEESGNANKDQDPGEPMRIVHTGRKKHSRLTAAWPDQTWPDQTKKQIRSKTAFTFIHTDLGTSFWGSLAIILLLYYLSSLSPPLPEFYLFIYFYFYFHFPLHLRCH